MKKTNKKRHRYYVVGLVTVAVLIVPTFAMRIFYLSGDAGREREGRIIPPLDPVKRVETHTHPDTQT